MAGKDAVKIEAETVEVVDDIETVDEDALNGADRSESTLTRVGSLGKGGRPRYSSISADTFEGKKRILKYSSDATPLIDKVKEPFNLKHMIITVVDIADQKTGEITTSPRAILVDDNGNSYHATSQGILTVVENFLNEFGEPSDWPAEGIPVQAVEKRGRNGFRFLTLELV